MERCIAVAERQSLPSHSPEGSSDPPSDCDQGTFRESSEAAVQQLPLLLTTSHLAQLLKRSERTVCRLESQGRLPSSMKVGSQRIWTREEMLDWFASGCPSRRNWERMHPKYRKDRNNKVGGKP